MIRAARGFGLIEIEGDAAFLSRDADGLDDAAALAAVNEAAVAIASRLPRGAALGATQPLPV